MFRHQFEILFDNVLANPDLLDKFFNGYYSSITCIFENELFYPLLISYIITKGWEKFSVWDRNVCFRSGDDRLNLVLHDPSVNQCSVTLSRVDKKTNFIGRIEGEWLTLYID